jgi:GT2 family glycosyltransferase
MKENNLVVIITLNYNQSKMTLECVDSILKSSYKNYSLIVVDNGSTEKEYGFLVKNLDSKVKVERIKENCGYVRGVNLGLDIGSKLSPDYFLIMNNDTIIDKDAIKYLVDAGIKNNQNAIVSGKVYHYDKPDVLQYVGGVYKNKKYLKINNLHVNEKDVGQCDLEAKRDMLDDIFWLLPQKVFRDVGSYSDKYFLYAEQADYALKAVKKGYKLIYTPKAKIWHKGSITTGGGDEFSPPVNFWRKKSSVIYLYRNSKKRYFYINLLSTLSGLIIKNILIFLHLRKINNKRSEYAALIGYLYGIKWVFNKTPDSGYNPFIK